MRRRGPDIGGFDARLVPGERLHLNQAPPIGHRVSTALRSRKVGKCWEIECDAPKKCVGGTV